MTFAVTHTARGHSIPSLSSSLFSLTASHLDALSERERETLLHTTLPQLLVCLKRESFRDALRVLFDAARAHSHTHTHNDTHNNTHTTHFTHNTATSPSRLSEEREEMKSPSDALRGLLHRCVGEIQLMRLSKQLAKADELNTGGMLRADLKTRQAFYASALQNGYYSRNEVRDLEDRGDIPGGDEYTIQTNLAPVDQQAADVSKMKDEIQ